MIASIVVSTFNRAEALSLTLEALARQDVPPTDYEVLVIDDGCTDATQDVLSSVSVPYQLRTFRLPVNRGVSAGRNIGLRNALGRDVIMLSDDLIAPHNFISSHVAALERFANTWVVGGFRQLETLTRTPFGRYLDRLERGFERARLGPPVEDDFYEMTAPTARNLSLPRADLERVGLFDERFRVTCEDQDLARRAAQQGIRFVYNAAVQCIHNDQAASLARYCRQQELGSRDTALLCDKNPELHSRSAIVQVNGYIVRGDGVAGATRKLAKRALASSLCTRALGEVIRVGERSGLPDRWLHRCYRLMIGLHTFRGFREGMREAGGRKSDLVRHLQAREG
jgi:GT2 family glycosyltransferase